MIKRTKKKDTVTRTDVKNAAAASHYTKEPVRDTAEQIALRDYINENQPLYFRIFYALSSETAHRPSDLAELKWGDFDFENHSMEIAVAKQTNAAATRAEKAVIKEAFNSALEKLRRRQQWDEWERLQEIGYEQWLAELPENERAPIKEAAKLAFDEAPVKTQKNTLPSELFNALKSYRETLTDSGNDDYVFPSEVTETPRVKGGAKILNKDGDKCHVSRVTFWRRMRDCIEAALKIEPVTVTQKFKKGINKGKERVLNLLRISLYSLRKTSLHFYAATGGMSYDHLEIAKEAVGHADIETTKRYTHANLMHALNDDVRGNIYSF